ncbi:EAL domain-containing protein [Shewanella sp. Arc9-LZ]|uniref:EAL domain-containing protein n=1 Tax=Shewanella sp. Arc9-LZ TaxID=2698686 RepID=UPI00137BE24B|nr:EAL domain-containing protein [Shewanella sp. Arc9-LZ]QHS13507.1 EAL domain-containing protein [Shewanella sp. Arc9-LZ]
MKLRKRINLILLPAIAVVFFTFSFFFYQSAKNNIIDAALSAFSYQFERIASRGAAEVIAVESMINSQLQSKEAADLFHNAKADEIDIRVSAQFVDRLIKSSDSKIIQDIAIFNLREKPISYINFEDPFVDASVTDSTHFLINKINDAIAKKNRQRIYAHYYQITATETEHDEIQLFRIFSPYLLVSQPLYNYTNDLVVIQTRLKPNYLKSIFNQEISQYQEYLSVKMFTLPLTEKALNNDIVVQQIEGVDSYHFTVKVFDGIVNISLKKAFFNSSLMNLKIKIGLGALALSLFCYFILHLLIYKQIIRPITELAEGVNGVKKGNSDSLILLNTNDEVAELNNSYLALIERIQQLANNDELTSLANRAYFNRELDHKLDSSEAETSTLGLLFIDLDNFKYVNDNFGHEAGDRVLVNFANRLTNSLRKTSRALKQQQYQCIARLGGDEFVVLLEGLPNVEELEAIAQRIVGLFDLGFEVDGKTYDVHASIGIAFQFGNKLKADTFLQQADSAMYAAKKAGKNSYCTYDDSLDNQLKEQKYIDSEVSKALRENSLYLVYLPYYDTETLEVKGFEVLLRAPELEKKGIGPDKFISIAEQSDLITKIDLWVINEALSKLANLRSMQGFDGTLAINISSRELFNDGFVAEVSSLMDQYETPPYKIIFEIAEAPLLTKDKKVLVNLTRLKALGIKIAIDNFGINYSAFSHLNHFRLDSLKIDRSFLLQMRDVQMGNKPLIDIIYDLANIHGLDVVIEGVQSEQELNHVKNLGCNTVQGFYLSKPLDWSQAQALVNKTNVSYLTTNKSR